MVAIATFTSVSASAQTAAPPPNPPGGVTIGIGYQLLHIPDETFPFGLNFDIAAPVAGRIDAVGEFGFAADEQTETGVGGTLRFFSFGGGPRWSMRGATAGRRPIVPFAQIIAGAVRTDADLRLNGARFTDGDWAFMLQPGAGVAVPLTTLVSATAQVDYRRAFFETAENEFRFVIGVRVNPR
jgi:hypothetical protein